MPRDRAGTFTPMLLPKNARRLGGLSDVVISLYAGGMTVRDIAAGHAQLTAWAQELGPIDQAGVEGTGSYGAGLTRHLLDQGISVMEVVRPNRQTRRRRGKTDAIDAETAARSVLAGTA
ncbi:transposase, partial [Micromonospora sp. ALFpr18c]|uniref:transposase n=1 Tax=Micromonospora sp. ALFpr18c TaxID=1458665 RepID=UPI00351A4645